MRHHRLPGAGADRPVGAPRPGPGPDPAALTRLLVGAWLEVRAGRRPLSQLRPLVTPAVHRRLVVQLHRQDRLGGPPASVVRVLSSTPCDDACEAVALVAHRGRTTAVAVRLERHRGVWRAVELMEPEAGLPALRTRSLPVDAPIRDAFDEAEEEERRRLALRHRDSA